MKQQNYRNHIRFYPPHHFVFLPVMLALVIAGIYCMATYPGQRVQWAGTTAAFIMIAYAGVMLRQHYALGNQNRIVRLEMRLRYYQLTGQRLEAIEDQLGFGRLAALRFAPDEELPTLIDRTLAENLSADEIKQSIKHWLPDEMRL